MLQSEEKESLLELLKNNNIDAVASNEKQKFLEPNIEFSWTYLPDSPHKRMLECIESNTNEHINLMMNNMDGSLSRFREVSTSFITGATILTQLPLRHDLVLYNKQLIKGLRYLFNAYSSNALI